MCKFGFCSKVVVQSVIDRLWQDSHFFEWIWNFETQTVVLFCPLILSAWIKDLSGERMTSIFRSSSAKKTVVYTQFPVNFVQGCFFFPIWGKIQCSQTGGCVQRKRAWQRTGVCFLLQWKDICRDTSDDETLFAVAPWQGIPQLLLKSLNLAGVESADALFRVQKTLCQTGKRCCVDVEDREVDGRGGKKGRERKI